MLTKISVDYIVTYRLKDIIDCETAYRKLVHIMGACDRLKYAVHLNIPDQTIYFLS